MNTPSTELELFTKCGLTRTEARILTFLIETSHSSAGMIAKNLGLKRPTTYSALQNLEAQNLIVGTKERGVIQYATISPRSIPIILKNKAREKFKAVEAATTTLQHQLPLIAKQSNHKIGGYEILTLDSPEAINGLIENALTSGNYSGIFNPQTAFAGEGKKIGERYLAIAARHKPHIKEIAISGPLCTWYRNKINNSNHELIEVAGDQSLPIDFILLKDAAIITTYLKGSTTAIVVKQKALCDFMKTFFDLLWNSLSAANSNLP